MPGHVLTLSRSPLFEVSKLQTNIDDLSPLINCFWQFINCKQETAFHERHAPCSMPHACSFALASAFLTLSRSHVPCTEQYR